MISEKCIRGARFFAMHLNFKKDAKKLCTRISYSFSPYIILSGLVVGLRNMNTYTYRRQKFENIAEQLLHIY